MTEFDVQSIVGAKLTGFHLAPRRVFHLSFTQYQKEQLIARPDRLYTQIWLVRPNRIVFKLTKNDQDRRVVSASLENSPTGVTSVWSFGGDDLLSVECKSISYVILPVVTWVG